eukprot:gene2937-3750_t
MTLLSEKLEAKTEPSRGRGKSEESFLWGIQLPDEQRNAKAKAIDEGVLREIPLQKLQEYVGCRTLLLQAATEEWVTNWKSSPPVEEATDNSSETAGVMWDGADLQGQLDCNGAWLRISPSVKMSCNHEGAMTACAGGSWSPLFTTEPCPVVDDECAWTIHIGSSSGLLQGTYHIGFGCLDGTYLYYSSDGDVKVQQGVGAALPLDGASGSAYGSGDAVTMRVRVCSHFATFS